MASISSSRKCRPNSVTWIGAFLLQCVDDYAIEQSATHISLTTSTENPARRLYERAGYTVVEQKTNARYERITGSAGRILMIKPLRSHQRL